MQLGSHVSRPRRFPIKESLDEVSPVNWPVRGRFLVAICPRIVIAMNSTWKFDVFWIIRFGWRYQVFSAFTLDHCTTSSSVCLEAVPDVTDCVVRWNRIGSSRSNLG